jgi:hypothetical protein
VLNAATASLPPLSLPLERWTPKQISEDVASQFADLEWNHGTERISRRIEDICAFVRQHGVNMRFVAAASPSKEILDEPVVVFEGENLLDIANRYLAAFDTFIESERFSSEKTREHMDYSFAVRERDAIRQLRTKLLELGAQPNDPSTISVVVPRKAQKPYKVAIDAALRCASSARGRTTRRKLLPSRAL